MEAYDLLAEGLERQGKPEKAQQVLKKAIEHSPNALLRQKHLAELAGSNQDIETAAEAWRQTVSLGTHSIHDNSKHYLTLSQTLCDLNEGGNNKGSAYAQEALSVLRQMEERFSNEPAIKVRSHIVQCRLLHCMGYENDANSLLKSLQPEIDNKPGDNASTSLDYAKTLFQLGHTDDAKHFLAQIAEQFSDNPGVLQKIENLLDEPVGYRQKIQARKLNRDGIKAFESGDLKGAVNAFVEALNIVPDHAALNLNLVQILMKEHQADPAKKSIPEQCQSYLDRLSTLPEQHRQYQRYQVLQRKLKGLL